MGYSFIEYPNLDKWFKKLIALPGYEENLEGAKYLVDVVKGIYENSLF